MSALALHPAAAVRRAPAPADRLDAARDAFADWCGDNYDLGRVQAPEDLAAVEGMAELLRAFVRQLMRQHARLDMAGDAVRPDAAGGRIVRRHRPDAARLTAVLAETVADELFVGSPAAGVFVAAAEA